MRLGILQGAALDGGDDRPRRRDLEAFADAIAAPGPTGVDEVDAGVEFLEFALAL